MSKLMIVVPLNEALRKGAPPGSNNNRWGDHEPAGAGGKGVLERAADKHGNWAKIERTGKGNIVYEDYVESKAEGDRFFYDAKPDGSFELNHPKSNMIGADPGESFKSEKELISGLDEWIAPFRSK